MKITPKQIISAFLIITGMVLMQFHSSMLWVSMIEGHNIYLAVMWSLVIEIIALWAWFSIEFRKDWMKSIKALGFLMLAISSSSIVIATASLKLSEPIMKEKQEVSKANDMLELNKNVIASSANIAKSASKWGNHASTDMATIEMVKAKKDIEKSFKNKEGKDTDSRLQMKSWIQIISLIIIMIAQIVSTHTIKSEPKEDETPKPIKENKQHEIRQKQEPKIDQPTDKESDKAKAAQRLLQIIEAKRIELNLDTGNKVMEELGFNKNDFTKVCYSSDGKPNGLGIKKLNTLEEKLKDLKKK